MLVASEFKYLCFQCFTRATFKIDMHQSYRLEHCQAFDLGFNGTLTVHLETIMNHNRHSRTSLEHIQ